MTGKSAGLGQRNKISISIPRVIEHPLVRGVVDSDILARAPRALRVMLVDDNIDAAATLAMLLETSGYDVTIEHEAIAALQRAQTLAPDVSLVDIGLPGMCGNELVHLLRQRPATAGAVFVAVTGYDQSDDRREIIAAGFDHHLVKPVDTVALAQILERVATAD